MSSSLNQSSIVVMVLFLINQNHSKVNMGEKVYKYCLENYGKKKANSEGELAIPESKTPRMAPTVRII